MPVCQASKKPKAAKQEREEERKVTASDVTAMAEKLKVSSLGSGRSL